MRLLGRRRFRRRFPVEPPFRSAAVPAADSPVRSAAEPLLFHGCSRRPGFPWLPAACWPARLGDHMTARELKEALQNIPDYFLVKVEAYSGDLEEGDFVAPVDTSVSNETVTFNIIF